MLSGFFIIMASDGSPARKVYCPVAEIENQLLDGETYEAADPLLVGFGITELQD